MKLKWLLVSLLCAGIAFAQERLFGVVSSVVKEGSIEALSSFVGTLYFEERSLLASEVSGALEENFVQAGARVKKGEPLARLNGKLLSLDLAAKEGLLLEAQARALKATQEFERIEKLYRSQSVSLKEYEDARFDSDSAAGNLKAIKAQTERIKAELERKVIRAPFDGIILQKLLNRGEWVAVGAPVFNIAKLNPMEARVEIPYEVLRTLRVGEELFAEVAGESYPARITSLIPLGEARARTFPIKIAIQNPKGILAEGLSVNVKIKKSSATSGLLVPRDSLVPRENGYVIFLLKDGTAREVRVEVLGFGGNQALIKSSAIAPNEHVIMRGQERLKDAQKVREITK